MADNYKILAQTTAASIKNNTNQANIVYTVPQNTQAAVSSISLINTSVAAESYYLGIVKEEDVDLSIEQSGFFVETPTFVAIGNNPSSTALYSTDGIAWTSRTLPSASYWYSVTYGAGKFVAVSLSSVGAYSTDGITWTQTSMPNASNWLDVVYGIDRFVAVSGSSANGPSSAAYSTNGITWSLGTIDIGTWWSVAYGAGKFVAVTYNNSRISYSTNGITWTDAFALPSTLSWISIVYGGGVFVAIAQGFSMSAYSTDGITWTAGSMPSSASWSSLTYGDNKFVAVASASSVSAYSTNGIIWSVANMPAQSSWTSVSYGNGRFVALSLGSTISAYSTNGISWTQGTAINIQIQSSAYGNPIVGSPIEINSISNAQTIIPTRSIQARQVDEIVGGITLSPGDQIRVYSESEDLIVQVYGVEIA